MKRTAKLLLALACIGLMLGAYLALTLIPQTAPEATEEQEILFAPNADAVTSIAFDCGQTQLTLEKKDGFWSFADDESFPVDQDIPKNMLAIVNPLNALRRVSEDPQDPALYGFDENAVRVTVTDDKQSYAFTIGAQCTGREGYYLRLADSPTVYLGDISVGIAYLHQDRYALIQIDPLPDADPEDVTKLTLHLPKGELILERAQESDFPNHNTLWALRNGDTLLPADEEKAQALLEQICALKLLSCTDHALTQEASEKIFAENLGFTVEYEHKAKKDDGEVTVTQQSYRLLLSLDAEENEPYPCRLTASSQLCTLEREAIDKILAAAKELSSWAAS